MSSDWNDIEENLKAAKMPESEKSKDAFWTEFKERIAEDESRNEVLDFPSSHRAKYLAIADAFLICFGLIFYSVSSTDNKIDKNPNSYAENKNYNEIKSLEVLAPNDGYIILTDDADATIIVVFNTDNEDME